MNTRCLFVVPCMLALALCAVPGASAQQQAPNTIAYQGYLTNTDGNPANGTTTVVFRLYTQRAGGNALWQETQPGVVFTDGVFTAHLGAVTSLEDVPFGQPLWLGVSVAGGAELSPRVALEAVPYALSVRGLRTVPGDLALNVLGGHSANTVQQGVSGATISGGGTDQNINRVTADFGTIGGGANNQAGNTATVAGGIENAADGESATVGGGLVNVASGPLAVVGGGGGNRAEATSATVAGGSSNTASGEYAAVGGGVNNQATNQWAAVGGGKANTAQGQFAVVGGGDNNVATGPFATVAGGSFNVAQGAGATVPGGESNRALGARSLAAGYFARAAHSGSFVWSDYLLVSDPTFSSTADNQFLIRARGGVGIGTNTPQGALHAVHPDDEEFDLVLGGTGDDALFGDIGILGSDPTLPSSDLLLVSNDAVAVLLDADGSDEAAHFSVAAGLLTTPAFEVDLDGKVATGHLTLRDALGEAGAPEDGGVYQDNVVYAWAHVNADGSAAARFGCTVTKVGPGRYDVDFDQN
ncbi:MAG: hypothetical protein R3247_14480, partial [Rhodothermales bacterium]|nr:hypothetical protein [Rhodothermales bacterium]